MCRDDVDIGDVGGVVRLFAAVVAAIVEGILLVVACRVSRSFELWVVV